MSDAETIALRKDLSLESVKALLMESGMDGIYARGLVADSGTIERLAFDENGQSAIGAETVARELVAKAPRHAFRHESIESSEEWIRRRFGGGGESADIGNDTADYFANTYARPLVRGNKKCTK